MSLKWNGDNVKRKMIRASLIGINRTMAQAVSHAKKNHPFTNRTSTAEKAIRITTAARAFGGTDAIGFWGFANLLYGKYLEGGTKGTRSRTSIRQRTRIMATGILKRPKNAGSPPWQGGSFAPTLRPAAAAMYPNLAKNIKDAFRG